MFITGTREINTVRPTIMADYAAMIAVWADALERSKPADIKGLKMDAPAGRFLQARAATF